MQIAKSRRMKWHDMSSTQRVGVIITGILQVILLVAALWDLRRRPAEMVRGAKGLWFGLVFINFIGPISYFIIGRKGWRL